MSQSVVTFSDFLLLRDNVKRAHLCVTAMATKLFDRLKLNFAHRCLDANFRSSLVMGKIALNVSKWWSF